MSPIIIIVVAVVVIFVSISALVSRYKRCPSDKILVIYGRTGGTSAKCVHGGGAFIWPVIQDYAFLDLKPLSIEANLTNALSRQNIRVDVPCRFTIAISTEIPTNAVSGNVYVEVSEVASNTLYFKVLSEAPIIDRIEPSSALPGNYIRLYGVWKPTSTTPPNTYLRIGGIDYPIDPNLNWNAYSYLKLLLPEGVPTGMQEVYLIYDGQVSNKTNLYVGIPLDFILANSSTLAAFSQIYVELLKPDQTTTSTAIEIYTEPMSVQWDVRNFSSSYTLTNYYTEDFSGKISDDGMSITEFSVHKKSLTNSDDIIFTLKENESINLDSIYYSYYTTNLLQNIYRGPEYLADQEDILSKFNITGTIEITTGQVCTIQSLIPKVGETSYNLYLTFK